MRSCPRYAGTTAYSTRENWALDGPDQRHDNQTIEVTLIEPGMTDTPFFDNSPGESALRDTDIAKAVIYALEQGPGVDVNEILIRPISQAL